METKGEKKETAGDGEIFISIMGEDKPKLSENIEDYRARCTELERKNEELKNLITLNSQKRLGTKAGMTMEIDKLKEQN